MSAKKKDNQEKELTRHAKAESEQEIDSQSSAAASKKAAAPDKPGTDTAGQAPVPQPDAEKNEEEAGTGTPSPSKSNIPSSPKKDGENVKSSSRKKIPRANEGELVLSGYFKAICSASPPNVPLADVPGYYKIVNVNTAILDQRALVDFDNCNSNINMPMVNNVQEKKKVKVLLSVGGPGGNFQNLKGSGSVDTFYNSLFSHVYLPWGFDGVTFDIQQLSQANRSYVTEGIRRFKAFALRNNIDPFISITALPTFVCPDAHQMSGIWNQLVPVINELNNENLLDLIQVMAYNYGSEYDPLESKGVPVGKPKEMLEYIFKSYADPFEITLEPESKTLQYNGFDPGKLMLGVLASAETGLKNFVPVNLVNEAIQELNQTYPDGIGGAMVYNINYDARKSYEFSQGLISGNK
jgi:chitinase